MKIRLVANKQFVNVITGIAVNFLEPLFDIVERFLICAVIDNNDSVRSAIVRTGNGPKSLLTSSVPDLQLYRLSVEIDGSDFEVHSDRTDVALCVCIICESEQQARLSDTGVSNEQKFEQVVTAKEKQTSASAYPKL